MITGNINSSPKLSSKPTTKNPIIRIATVITPTIAVMDAMSILLKMDLSSSIFEMFLIANSMRI